MQKKWIFISLAIAAIGTTLGVISYRRSKAIKGELKNSDNSLEGSSDEGDALKTYESGSEEQGSSQLKKSEKLTSNSMVIGSKGRPVGIMQAYMNYKYGTNIKVDGRYGTELRDALKDKLKWFCSSYIGDKTCEIKNTDSPYKDATYLIIKKDKGFMDYLKKVMPPVAREYESVIFGGAKY